MAIGDAGAAKGLTIYPAAQDVRLGYQNDNQRADDIAAEIDARTAADTAEVAARNAAVATRAALAHTHPVGDINGGTWNGTVAAGGNAVSGGNASFSGNLDVAGSETVAANLTVSGSVFVPNRAAVVSAYVAAYINSDGRLGVSPSSKRFKKEIKSWSPDRQAVLAMRLVTFRYNAETFGSADAPLEVGLIAEELETLGLGWLVFYDEDGQPLGVHYERVALALIPVIQDIDARLSALERATT